MKLKRKYCVTNMCIHTRTDRYVMQNRCDEMEIIKEEQKRKKNSMCTRNILGAYPSRIHSHPSSYVMHVSHGFHTTAAKNAHICTRTYTNTIETHA